MAGSHLINNEKSPNIPEKWDGKTAARTTLGGDAAVKLYPPRPCPEILISADISDLAPRPQALYLVALYPVKK